MKPYRIIFFLICLAATNLYAKDLNKKTFAALHTYMLDHDTIKLTGTIIKQASINKKGGMMPQYPDYLLATATDTLFIKVVAGNFTTADLEPYVGKSIKITGYKEVGTLDYNGKEGTYFSARSGHYIVLLTIEKIN